MSDTQAAAMARFATRARFSDIPAPALAQLKLRVLDSLGCALGALDGQPIQGMRDQLREFGGAPLATAIGGERTSPAYAAWYNTALTRYLDYMDSFLVAGETCHPSDNLGPVLAATEFREGSGSDFLTALAVAYQVQCRLCWEAPLQHKGFDHVTQMAYSVPCGVGRALEMEEERVAAAIGMCGVSLNTLWVTRTDPISQWKGLASSQTAFAGTNATFLAMRGVTGPSKVIEGKHGFHEVVSGKFEIDWEHEPLDIVPRTVLKRYNSEVHTQPVVEAVLELAEREEIGAADVQRVEVEAFRQVLNAVGGGEAGDKLTVRAKEQADHNVRYLVAVALLDGDVRPQQFLPDRITRDDVQQLLQRVWVRQSEEMNSTYPKDTRCRVTIITRDGREHAIEKSDFLGFNTRPMSKDQVVAKFERLAGNFADAGLRQEIVAAVDALESIQARDLTELLARAATPLTSDMMREAVPIGAGGWDHVVEASFPASDPPPTST